MTHRYTLMVGGTILPGADEPVASAIAWAGDTILALGSDAAVGEISRGDSHVIELRGAYVVPVDEDGGDTWPGAVTLEVGSPASFAIFGEDPRRTGEPGGPRIAPMAVIRNGRLVAGAMPGGDPAAHAHEGGH